MGAFALPFRGGVLGLARRRLCAAFVASPRHTVRLFRYGARGPPDPLRIMFLASGDGVFSSPALELLHGEMRANPSLVSSVDVVTSPPRRVGRGRRELRRSGPDVQAEALGLPVHITSGFEALDEQTYGRGTDPRFDQGEFSLDNDVPKLSLSLLKEKRTNLLIAVSYGMFIPAHFIRAVKYGGLNLHPSLLPDLRGAAPIPWAIALNRLFTGVTLQSLHEEKFDHGLILARTPEVPLEPSETTLTLQDKLKALAAPLLVEGLRAGVHDPRARKKLSLPLTIGQLSSSVSSLAQAVVEREEEREEEEEEEDDDEWKKLAGGSSSSSKRKKSKRKPAKTRPAAEEVAAAAQDLAMAPKIRPGTLEMRWDRLAGGDWSAEDVGRRIRAFGPLRTRFMVDVRRIKREWPKALTPTVAQIRQQRERQRQLGQSRLAPEPVQLTVADVGPVQLDQLSDWTRGRLRVLTTDQPWELLSASDPQPSSPLMRGSRAAGDEISSPSSAALYLPGDAPKSPKAAARLNARAKARGYYSPYEDSNEHAARLLIAQVYDHPVTQDPAQDPARIADHVALLCIPDKDGKSMLAVVYKGVPQSIVEMLRDKPFPSLCPGSGGHSVVRINMLHVAGDTRKPAWWVVMQLGIPITHHPVLNV